MSKVMYTQRLSVGMTDKMDSLLEDLAISRTRKGKPVNKSDLIREAVRQYLDQQVEQIVEEVAALREHLQQQADFLVNLGEAIQPLIDLAAARAKKG